MLYAALKRRSSTSLLALLLVRRKAEGGCPHITPYKELPHYLNVLSSLLVAWLLRGLL